MATHELTPAISLAAEVQILDPATLFPKCLKKALGNQWEIRGKSGGISKIREIQGNQGT